MANIIEPAHEILVLFVLRKHILQTRMRSHPLGLDVWFLVGPFVYFHTSCVPTAMALARLRACAVSPSPSLFAYAISTINSWAGSYNTKTRSTWLVTKLFTIVHNSENRIIKLLTCDCLWIPSSQIGWFYGLFKSDTYHQLWFLRPCHHCFGH